MKQLLGFSRKARAERAWIDVVETVKESVDLVRSVIPQTILIKQIYPPPARSLTLFGDRTQIQQVLINLASNAMHAMRGSGGELTIEVRDLGADCKIIVRDTGPGVPTEIQSHIFEPFFTTKPVGEGTGMGLSVVQGIVNSHLGRIDLNPNVSKGSEFTITLPLSAPPAELGVKASEDHSSMDDVSLEGGDETILVIDDEVDLTSVIADTLEIFGYSVLRAHNAHEGVAHLQQSGRKIDLILTDDSMPGMTGLEFARNLKNGDYGTFSVPVILMTGFDRHEPDLSIETGAIREFLRKPLDAVALNEAIRSTLDRAPV
ncbi:MAG: response regulator [Proteobacteria bacterium]|nr:MAG: response regulator [Pseudomonadota bacterium]